MPDHAPTNSVIKRFAWRSPLWIALNVLPVALAATAAKVFGSASIALIRTTLAAPPAERFADLGLALIALFSVGVVALVGVVFFQLMLAPAWKRPHDAFEIHPDRLVAIESNARREIRWESFSGGPAIERSGSGADGFFPKRTVVYAIAGESPLRLPDGHLHQREIAEAIARARAAHAAHRDS